MDQFEKLEQGIVFDRNIWVCPHAGRIHHTKDNHLVFSDGNQYDWNLIRTQSLHYAYKRIRIELLIRPTDDCNSNIYINHWGGKDICKISPDGSILFNAFDAKCTVKIEDSYVKLDIEYFNCHPTVSLGTCKDQGKYCGTGRPQYIIKNIMISICNSPSPGDEQYYIIFADVGARGGIHDPWGNFQGFLQPILFEPSSAAANELSLGLKDFFSPILIQAGLADFDGDAELNITRHPGCSSILIPNQHF